MLGEQGADQCQCVRDEGGQQMGSWRLTMHFVLKIFNWR